MSEATITYDGTTIASVGAGSSVILATKGKYLTDDITVETAESIPSATGVSF